jgi:Zn-dependent peptidase ImmA (M78 family)/DNA-binding XRE family transcriptional regulator
MFTAMRLSLARKRRGMTKKRLAEAVSVTPHTILRYESGEMMPSQEVIKKIARTLDFDVEFFDMDEVDEIREDAASFRSMAAMTASERDGALAAGSIAYIFNDWVEKLFDLPTPVLETLPEEQPEVAARSLRQKWTLGERPIKKLIPALEAKGIRIFSLAENTRTVDAFSVWRGNRPYIFLNTFKSAERSRFDAAHELGHLVLHRHGGPQGREAEDEADRFASAFLMPTADVKAMAPRVHTLNQVIQLKSRWGVSALAMTYRLHKLKSITDWQYRTFCIRLSELGRDKEPNEMPRDVSSLWQKVLVALWAERKTKAHIAAELHLPQSEIENLLFGLISPGPPNSTDPITDGISRLRLVAK